MSKAIAIAEAQQEAQYVMLETAFREVWGDYQRMQDRMEEHLSSLDMMMQRDTFGWSPLTGEQAAAGVSLAQLKRRARQLREATALEPLVGNGARLLQTYVWSDPIIYSEVPGIEDPHEKTGRGVTNVGKFYHDPWNQRFVFGAEARKARESALYTDGGYLLLCDEETRRMRPIPLERVSDVYTDPEFPDEVWAYRLAWTDQRTQKEEVEWVFTDTFIDKRPKMSKRKGAKAPTIKNTATDKDEPIAMGRVLIDGWVNRQVGWTFGFPHAGAILEWVREYNRFLRNGIDMTSAMASIWATAKTQSKAGTNQVAAKVAEMLDAGNTAVGGVELAPLATAGRVYDFKSGLTILARVAQGLGVSVVALSQSPGDAGSSYGAGNLLDLPTRLNIEQHRKWAAEFDVRVMRWLGAADASARFPRLVDGTELLRLRQAAQIAWNSGLFEPEEMKAKFAHDEGDYTPQEPVPSGVLLPNNEKSLARKDIDTDSGPKTGTPGQGQSNGTGEVPDDTSTRDNTIQ